MTLTEPNTTTPPAAPGPAKSSSRARPTVGEMAIRYFAVIAFVVLCIYFSSRRRCLPPAPT